MTPTNRNTYCLKCSKITQQERLLIFHVGVNCPQDIKISLNFCPHCGYNLNQYNMTEPQIPEQIISAITEYSL